MRLLQSPLRAALALSLALTSVAACAKENPCSDDTAPVCVDDRIVRTCVDGVFVATACAEDQRCNAPIGCSACAPGQLECSSDRSQVLVCSDDGALLEPDATCAANEQCLDEVGCRACIPNETICDGDTLSACRVDGSGHDVVATCAAEAGEVCYAGLDACVDLATLCAVVESAHSNVGCEFWSAPLAACGSPLDNSFALMIGNPYPVETTVTFERNGRTAGAAQVIPALGSTVVHLPCASTPRQPGIYTYSAVRRSGAYHVVASTPITVVQLQPTEDPTVVPDDYLRLGDGALLMPARSLECGDAAPCEFYAMSMTTWLSNQGSLAIVGTDDRPVTVNVRLTAPINPSIDGFTGRPDSIPLLFEGEELSFTLNPGDVVELMTAVPASGFFFNIFSDFTGTRVRANGSVAVISGNELGFVPVGASVPNSLGESIPPTSTWGTEHVVARPRALASEPYVIKVLAAEADTDISFVPELYPARRLRAGQSFELFAEGDVVVRSTKPVLVAQLTVGTALYESSVDAAGRGGPAMTLVPSIDRGVYDVSFTALPSVANGLSLGALQSAEITLDGRRVSLAAIEGTAYGASRVVLGPGVHRLRSNNPVIGALQGVGFNGAFLVPIATTYPAGLE